MIKTQSRLVKNVSWIFFGNVMHSLLNFLLGIYVARKLSLNDNGLINYSTSWIAFFTALASLGFSSTITKEFSRSKGRDGELLCSSIVSRVGASVIAMILLQIIVRILSPGEQSLYIIVLCQSTTILFGTLDVFVYWYRYHNKADLVAILRIIAFAISALWRVIVLVLGANLLWYVIGTVAETALFGTFMAFFFFRAYKGKFFFSGETVKLMLKESYPFIFSAILSTIYTQVDKIMLKSFMDNSAVALYSISSHLALAISIIPSALIEGFRPDIMEYKGKNEVLYEKRVRQLYCVVFWTSISYCVAVSIFPGQILRFLYGEQYVAAKNSLALIVWYSTFAYFGSINNLFMVAEGKAKWVQLTTLSGALGNVVFNYLLIPIWGIVGAAAASLFTQFVANFVLLAVIPDLRPAVKLMLRGIAFQDTGVVDLVKKQLKS